MFFLLVFLSAVAWLFWPVFLAEKNLAYRDAGHFYFPLYQFVNCQWRSGIVPLWNPFDNLGQPLLATASAAVFYPGKLAFALPFDYSTNYATYIVGHLVFAGASIYVCARVWGTSQTGAALGAVSYALSGAVLFQYCNVIYLVGAAWMPLALLASERMLRGVKKFQWALILSVILTMMVLGGEPQAVYHALLSAVVLMFLATFRDRRCGWRRCAAAIGCLAFTVATTLILSAVQVVPSFEWARTSERNSFERPRNLYEGVTEMWQQRHAGRRGITATLGNIVAGIVTDAPRGTHQASTDQFSIGPWRFAELIVPNAGGRQFPIHRRWINGLPAEGAVWTPSLYFGLIPLVAAWGTWRKRNQSVLVRWLWAISILASAASCGQYGIGWMIHEVCYLFSGELSQPLAIGDSVGGVYWLMKTFLPGYIFFRYPAKLFTVATLGLCLLAGRGWDVSVDAPKETSRRFVQLGVFLFVLLIGVIGVGPWWQSLLQDQIHADPLFGPCDVWGGYADLTQGLIQSLLICVVSWFLLRWWAKMPPQAFGTVKPSIRCELVGSAILMLTAVELVLAHGWTIQLAPRHTWSDGSTLVGEIHRTDERQEGTSRLFRAIGSTSYPSRWARKGSQHRHQEGLAWDRDTIYPNFHLRPRIRTLGVTGTMSCRDYHVLMEKSRELSRTNLPGPQWLNALAVGWLMTDSTSRPDQAERVDGRLAANGEACSDIVLWQRHANVSRAWFVSQANVEMKVTPTVLDQIGSNRCAEETLTDDGVPRDLRGTAVVWSPDAGNPMFRGDSLEPVRRQAPAGDARVRIVRDEPRWVEIDAHLPQAGLVVLADQFYPGWKLSVATEGRTDLIRLPILRTNTIMRGAMLPAGKHRLIYRYRPGSFYWGAVASGLGWLLLLGVTLWRIAGHRQKNIHVNENQI